MVLVLHEADRLDAARHGDRHAVHDHPLGRDRDRLEARGAEAVDRRGGGGHGQPGPERGLARDVVARRALGHGAPDDDVLDLGRVQASPLDGVLDDVPGQGGPVGVVERPPVRLADGGPRRRDDHRLCHDPSSWPGSTGRAGFCPRASRRVAFTLPQGPAAVPRRPPDAVGRCAGSPWRPRGRPVQSGPSAAPGARRRPSPGRKGRCDERARPPHHGRLPADEGVRREPADPDRGPGHPRHRRGRAALHRRAERHLLRQPRPRQQAPRGGRLPPDRAAGPGGPDARDQRPGARAREAPARHHAAPVHDRQAPLRRLGGDRGGDQDGPPVPQAGGARDEVQDPVALPRLPRRAPATPWPPAAGRAGACPTSRFPAGSSTSTPRIRTVRRFPAAPTRSAPRTRGSWKRSSSSRAPRRSRASSPSRS